MKFLNFPPKISPRMSVEGEEWSLPEPSPPPSPQPTSLTSPSSLLTGDTSNLICQHSQKFLQSHISPDCYKCVFYQMSRSPPRKYICLPNDQSRGKYWIQKLVDNLLNQISSNYFACETSTMWIPHICRWTCDEVTKIPNFQTTNNPLSSCLKRAKAT